MIPSSHPSIFERIYIVGMVNNIDASQVKVCLILIFKMLKYI
ncbi:hypothetical protein Mpsy_1175 [Methanolobus psychrophilus R15]|nr:hypothetical protein Mpsy_1175 [Methanolobus psychrophilus R15]